MRPCNRGFTLIEVALAITILGIGLVTITTLSTRLVDDTFYEVQRAKGTILALYLMETQNNTPTDDINSDEGAEIKNESGQLVSKLDAIGFFAGLDKKEDFPYLDQSWTYELTYEPMSLPFTETPFEIFSASVRWGPNEYDLVRLQSILKGKPKKNLPNQPGPTNE